MIRLNYVLALVLTTLMPACGDDDSMDNGADAGPPIDPTLTSIQERIFTQSCSFSSCHDSTQPAGGLSLELGMSHAALVGVTPATPQAATDGLQLVMPNNPDMSFLLIKLMSPVPSGYGALMPASATSSFDQNKIDAITAWINAGALDN